MTVYERIEEIRKTNGISQGTLERELGFSNGSISKWKNSMPKPERLQKVANYFNVTLDYLMTGKTTEEEKIWYTNPETAKVAQEIFDDPDLHALFDAAKDATPEALRSAAEMLKVLKHQYDSKE